MSVSPLLTALFAWLFLRQHIAARTWCAIAVALFGIVWMFVNGIALLDGRHATGMLIALGVPLATAINVITMKKAGQRKTANVDLVPAVLSGSLFSAIAMLPLAWPLHISTHDLAILAALGFFQLGLPCVMMVIAAKSLSAPEISLLALLEVLLGPIWAWLGAGEVPSPHTLIGGVIVLAALVFNELGGVRGMVSDKPS
jgi:drug/metabolite transporter (DMT)-like permease